MLLNKRQLEKLKEDWWRNDEYQAKCEKPEDQSDGISIQNIGGVFIVIFVGIGMACVTLVFEYWYYRHRKSSKKFNKGDNTVNSSVLTVNKPLKKSDTFIPHERNVQLGNVRPRNQGLLHVKPIFL